MCSRWHSDGTFDVRPPLFEQIYVVCRYNEGFMIPCIYTLRTKRDELTYSKIFHNIIKLDVDRQGVPMKPSHLTCNFEIAAIEAFKSIFSDAQVKTGRGGAVIRALAFYTDASSSIPGKGKNQAIGHSPVDPAVNGYLVL